MDVRTGIKGNEYMSSVIPPVKDTEKGRAFSHKTLVKERPVTADESVVEAPVDAVTEVDTEAAHAGSLVDFVAPISEDGQHHHIYDLSLIHI